MGNGTYGFLPACGVVGAGGCLAGCAAACAIDTVLPVADILGATVVNASATTASVSACAAAFL